MDFPSKGKFTITQRGLDLLKLNLQSIRIKTLNQFSEFEEFTKRLQQKKIVLIDGKKLTQLMIDNNIGVSTSATYTIKNIDIDYFDID